MSRNLRWIRPSPDRNPSRSHPQSLPRNPGHHPTPPPTSPAVAAQPRRAILLSRLDLASLRSTLTTTILIRTHTLKTMTLRSLNTKASPSMFLTNSGRPSSLKPTDSFIALRKAEKEEENRARERIRQKLHQDKVERRGQLGLPPQSHPSYRTATPMVQEDKVEEKLPVVSAGIRVPSTTNVDLMRKCLRSLRRNNKDDDIKVKRAFETLLIYIRNVAKDPDEDKFRKIRLSNPAFKERVGIFEQGIKFLELCGFERVEGGRYLYLPRSRFDMAEFKSAGNELQSAITNPFYGLLSTEE